MKDSMNMIENEPFEKNIKNNSEVNRLLKLF